jgi:hypothetical protein
MPQYSSLQQKTPHPHHARHSFVPPLHTNKLSLCQDRQHQILPYLPHWASFWCPAPGGRRTSEIEGMGSATWEAHAGKKRKEQMCTRGKQTRGDDESLHAWETGATPPMGPWPSHLASIKRGRRKEAAGGREAPGVLAGGTSFQPLPPLLLHRIRDTSLCSDNSPPWFTPPLSAPPIRPPDLCLLPLLCASAACA